MKKASKILFLIGGILGIFGAIAYIALSGVCFYAVAVAEDPDVPQWVVELIQKIVADSKVTPEQAVAAIATVAIVFMVLFILSIPAIVLSFVCSSKDKRPLPLLIVATAISLTAGSALSVVGGVLGIVSWSTVERKEREAQAQ